MEPINPIVESWVREAKENPDAFWGRAAEQLPWLKKSDRVFEWTPPTFRWFIGGQTNLAYSALDHHVQRGWGGHTALVCLNEQGGRQVFTCAQLLDEVKRTSAALRGIGVGKGDRITIYMPPCAEAIILMLAIVRIGAIHVVVFAGFGAQALTDRVHASGSHFVFTADITYRKGKTVRLKEIVDRALEIETADVERVVVLNRTGDAMQMCGGRDITWSEFLNRGAGQDTGYAPMESNEPAFILATSGTTAKPKLTLHTQGGYQVYINSMGKWIFDLNPADVWWSTSDIGPARRKRREGIGILGCRFGRPLSIPVLEYRPYYF
jgi:acetyl-CoA synthetase